jgi:hypothetical protein
MAGVFFILKSISYNMVRCVAIVKSEETSKKRAEHLEFTFHYCSVCIINHVAFLFNSEMTSDIENRSSLWDEYMRREKR